MGETIRVRMSHGILKPLEKLELPEGKEVTVTFVDRPTEENTKAFLNSAGS